MTCTCNQLNLFDLCFDSNDNFYKKNVLIWANHLGDLSISTPCKIVWKNPYSSLSDYYDAIFSRRNNGVKY